MSAEIIEIDGMPRKLGTLVGVQKLRFQSFTGAGLMELDDKELRQLCDENKRTRDIFGKEWQKDQKSHGSCNGFAGAYALERARYFRGQPRVALSGASLYSMINGGQDEGSMLEDGMRVLERTGILTEATCPWNQIYMDTRGQNPERSRFKAAECITLETERQLWTFLALRMGGAVVAVHVTNAYMNVNRYGIAGASGGPGNHAIMLDDAIYDPQYGGYKGNNMGSWGPNAQDNGSCYIAWKENMQSCVNNHRFYGIRFASDDSQGENPPSV